MDGGVPREPPHEALASYLILHLAHETTFAV
jgi:hypothetical protein